MVGFVETPFGIAIVAAVAALVLRVRRHPAARRWLVGAAIAGGAAGMLELQLQPCT